MGTCTRGVLIIKWILIIEFFSKDSNGYLYLRGPNNRGVATYNPESTVMLWPHVEVHVAMCQ